MALPIKWLWEHPQYGVFPYDMDRVAESLNKIQRTRGNLEALLAFFSREDLDTIEIASITKEIMDTSQIEGEYLLRDSVRDSVAKAILHPFNPKLDRSTRQTDALVELIIDSRLNQKEITINRLHGWHNAIFSHGRGEGTKEITVGAFRDYDDMKVIEGAIGRPIVKYIAIPEKKIEQSLKKLLDYCNNSTENPYIKSAIVHLWFTSIHPYDDGNGRISRALSDYVLTKDMNEEIKAYSISSAILSSHQGYYDSLDHTTNLYKNRDFNFTNWINWHTNTLNTAMENAIKDIEFIIVKTKFWDKHRQNAFNPRQIKVLENILTTRSSNKTLSTKKYMELTDTSKTSASRDISELLSAGCIAHKKDTSGRNTTYEIVLENKKSLSLKDRYKKTILYTENNRSAIDKLSDSLEYTGTLESTDLTLLNEAFDNKDTQRFIQAIEIIEKQHVLSDEIIIEALHNLRNTVFESNKIISADAKEKEKKEDGIEDNIDLSQNTKP